jgi:hypothetical protein
VIGNAVHVMRIASGKLRKRAGKPPIVLSGKAGGTSQAETLTPNQRSEIARAAAGVRWKNLEPGQTSGSFRLAFAHRLTGTLRQEA